MVEGDDRRLHPASSISRFWDRSEWAMSGGDEDGPCFKGTRHKLDVLRGGLGQRPTAREPSVREEVGDRLRHINNRWYRRSILKKWNKFLDLKR
jgi:hypothetical protein